MFEFIPEQWRDTLEFLLIPISWVPVMQQVLLEFFLDSSSAWGAFGKYALLLFPALLLVSAVWCTQLSIYTLPFRSKRISYVSNILLAWWDGTWAVWQYWVGLFRMVVLVAGWLLSMLRLFLKLVMEAVRQIIVMPFAMTGRMTKSYFQPGVPWIAFLLLILWSLLEALIFTYTLFPTVSEVMADLVGTEASPLVGPVLYLFLFFLILGSFACLEVLFDTFKKKEYKFVVQMVLVELFVMFFEVMFLYRELVDAITPWIAQQTGEQFKLGIWFTMSVATFGWLGIRGMTWFLFGQFGTPPLLAFISRRPMVHAEGTGPARPAAETLNWWKGPIDDFKREIGWLHERGYELLEFLSLPALHVLAAALNFAMILVTSRPVFTVPFKSLKEVMEARELFTELHLLSKKAGS